MTPSNIQNLIRLDKESNKCLINKFYKTYEHKIMKIYLEVVI